MKVRKTLASIVLAGALALGGCESKEDSQREKSNGPYRQTTSQTKEKPTKQVQEIPTEKSEEETVRQTGLEFIGYLRNEKFSDARNLLYIVNDKWASPMIGISPEGKELKSFFSGGEDYLNKFESFVKNEKSIPANWTHQLMIMGDSWTLPSIREDIEKNKDDFRVMSAGKSFLLWKKQNKKWKIAFLDDIEYYDASKYPKGNIGLEKRLSEEEIIKYNQIENETLSLIGQTLTKEQGDFMKVNDRGGVMYYEKGLKMENGQIYSGEKRGGEVIWAGRNHEKIWLGKTYSRTEGTEIEGTEIEAEISLGIKPYLTYFKWRGFEGILIDSFGFGYVNQNGNWSKTYLDGERIRFEEKVDKKQVEQHLKLIDALIKKYPAEERK